MCVAAAALPLIAAGVSAAGSVVGGMQAMAQSSYEGKVAERNAALDNERAKDSIMRGREEARQLYRRIGEVRGDQTAAMAANGIDVGYGSARRTAEDTAMLADEDVSNLYRNIHERTRGFEISASNAKAEANAARFRGRSAMVNSLFEAGSSLMGGFQQHRVLKAKGFG